MPVAFTYCCPQTGQFDRDHEQDGLFDGEVYACQGFEDVTGLRVVL